MENKDYDDDNDDDFVDPKTCHTTAG